MSRALRRAMALAGRSVGPKPGSKANPLRMPPREPGVGVFHVKQCDKVRCPEPAVWQLGARAWVSPAAKGDGLPPVLDSRIKLFVCLAHYGVQPAEVFTEENWTRTVAAMLARGLTAPSRDTLEITHWHRSEWVPL